MANLIIQENGVERTTPAVHGEDLTIVAPCDCSAVEGVQINGVAFPFYDTLGNVLSSRLFAEGSLIRVMIDVTNGRALILNAPYKPKKTTIHLPAAAWVDNGNDIFTQNVTIEGGTANSLVTLQPSDGHFVILIEDGISFLKVDNNNGVFTAKVGSVPPSIDMTIQATLTEVVS